MTLAFSITEVGALLEKPTIIQYICGNRAHTRRGAGTLAMHETVWAFCPSDEHSADHVWVDIGGITLEAARTTHRTGTVA